MVNGVGGSPPLQQWLQANPNATLTDAIKEAKKTGDDGGDTGIQGLSQEEIEVLENHFDGDVIDNSEIEAFQEKSGRDFEFNEGEVHFHRNEIGVGENGTREVNRESGSVDHEVPLEDSKSAGEGEIELDDRLEYMRDHRTDFIDPENGYDFRTPDGGNESVTLENAILSDFGDVQGVFEDGADLRAGIDAAFPDNTLEDGDAAFLFNMIEYGNSTGPDGDPTEDDVLRLQQNMAKIDGSFEELVRQNGADGGKDGKYGYATTEQIRNLSADIRPETEIQTEDFSVVETQSFEDDTPPPFEDYDEVMIVMDRSGSMGNDRRDVARQVREAVDNSSNGTKFGLVTFADNADGLSQGEMRSKLGGDPDDIISDLHNVRDGGTSDESGFNAALKAFRQGGFSSPEDVDARRLMRIYTDEREQDASPEEMAELQRLAAEGGVEVQFIFSKKIHGTMHHKAIDLQDLTPDMIRGDNIRWRDDDIPGTWVD